MAKYLATSLAIEKVVSAPRVISSCLPISTTSISLVGSESRSTMLPASFAAWVPVFMATPTSAWASAGASLVPSPLMATSLPLACSSRMSFILASGVASARKSSTPASAAMAAAVSGLSPVIITVRMPMRRSSAKRSRMPPLTMSLRWMTPSSLPVRRRRRAACRRPWRCARRRAPTSRGAVDAHVAEDRRRPRPCGSTRPSRSMPLMRVCGGERDEVGAPRLAASRRRHGRICP